MTHDDRTSEDALPATGSLTLYDDYVPAVTDAKYRLVVQQSVVFGEQKLHYYRDQEFEVIGTRFQLAPDDIHARFPPANGSGNYQTTLPHIVLRKRVLPWERRLEMHDTATEPAPWLALLVLSQRELSQAAQDLAAGDLGSAGQANPLLNSVTAASLISTEHSEGVILLPVLDDEGDDAAMQVQVLDLPLALFREVCPTLADIGYLAHVRSVDSTDKAPLHMHAIGDFSVVVANRLPQPGGNGVFLVSLEGWESTLLPEGHPDQRDTKQADRVRLVVLESWTFTDDEDGIHTFGQLMKGLDAAPFGGGSSADSEDYVTQMLSRGYVPIEYQPACSSATFAWYRGPLAPQPVAEPTQDDADANADAVGRFDRADAALIFDAAHGLFDLSYASAWQLGRLTALASPEIAGELRRSVVAGHDAIAAIAGAEAFLEEHSTAVQRVWDNIATEQRDEAINDADAVMDFMVRLALLFSVPYDYLVAHGRLLPPEAIRFFYVDDVWVDALIEGALSTAVDCSHDLGVSGSARSRLNDTISGLIAQHHRREQGLPPLTTEEIAADNYRDLTKTGFLLRSSVVSGWPGLEVLCYDGAGDKMPVLRMEHIGGDVLFCLASGAIKHMLIKEPGEGLRFGLDDEYAMMLRCWHSGTPGAPFLNDDGLEVKLTVKLQRAGSRDGVLDIAMLAAVLAKNLTHKDEAPVALGSAAFAVQMMRSPEKQQINIGTQTADDTIKDEPDNG